jgi:hypothetical protein
MSLVSTMLRPAAELVGLGMAAERRARALVARTAEEALLGALEATLGSQVAREASQLVADRIVDSPATERLVARVIESKLLDEAVARLLESEDLWLLVDEIAHSPEVTDAIGRQGIGFAEQMAGVVRDRSRTADARVERLARRVLRRGPPGIEPAGPATPPSP